MAGAQVTKAVPSRLLYVASFESPPPFQPSPPATKPLKVESIPSFRSVLCCRGNHYPTHTHSRYQDPSSDTSPRGTRYAPTTSLHSSPSTGCVHSTILSHSAFNPSLTQKHCPYTTVLAYTVEKAGLSDQAWPTWQHHSLCHHSWQMCAAFWAALKAGFLIISGNLLPSQENQFSVRHQHRSNSQDKKIVFCIR